MKKLTQDEFKLLKGRLYRSINSLENALRSCPDLENLPFELNDGHRLSPKEIIGWLEAARSECWKFAPAETQRRHIQMLMREQPRG